MWPESPFAPRQGVLSRSESRHSDRWPTRVFLEGEQTVTRRLLIVGAGGFGREVLQWAQDIAAEGCDWTIGGFLDADRAALDSYACEYRVLSSPAEYEPSDEDLLVCAIGDPATRMRVTVELTSRGARFATLVHPTAIVGSRSLLGEGCILCPRVTMTTDIRLGRHVIVNTHSTIGHDVTIGDCCSLFSHCDVTGGATLEPGVTMGSHAAVLPGVRVGEFARISAGSVVSRRVKPFTTVFGVPAKKLLSTEPSAASSRAA
jgi:sugar O-acyltransferase (sialic acid O-acetyltransferase NeuD family)